MLAPTSRSWDLPAPAYSVASLSQDLVFHSVRMVLFDKQEQKDGERRSTLHSHDATVTVSAQRGSASVLCRTRRCDVLQMSLSSILDIGRKRDDCDLAHGSPLNCVAEFVAKPCGASFAVRAYQAVFQSALGDKHTDALFFALLRAWRTAAPAADSFSDQHTIISTASVVPIGFASSKAVAIPAHVDARAIQFDALAAARVVQRETETLPYTPQDLSRPPQGPVVETYPMLTLEHLPSNEVDRMLSNCSSLEAELAAIRNRRHIRHEALARPYDAGSSYKERPNAADVPIADTVCPHCSGHCSEEHPAVCSHRPVRCAKCATRMQLRHFASHAAECSASNDVVLSPQQQNSAIPNSIPASSLLTQQHTSNASPQQQENNSNKEGAKSKSMDVGDVKKDVTFADIPRVQSIIVKKSVDHQQSSGAAQESDEKPVRFADASTPRRRLTSFVQDVENVEPRAECPWCHKVALMDHPHKCAERRVLCTACGEEVFLRDKREHRLVCKRFKTGEDVQRTSVVHYSAANDFGLRKEKYDSYRRRLDALQAERRAQ